MESIDARNHSSTEDQQSFSTVDATIDIFQANSRVQSIKS